MFFPNSEDPDEMPHYMVFHPGQAPNCFFPNSEEPDEMPHDVAFHQGQTDIKNFRETKN